jgi:purine-nucleoside phosphorylase
MEGIPMPVHIKAHPKDVSPLVLITGDPTRAEYIAANFLTEVKCYNEVRMEPGFTGIYKPLGKRVSVQSVGIGMSSLRIYVNELIQLGAKKIIRIGTCGSFQENIGVGDLIIAQGGCSDSGMNLHRFGPLLQFAPIPDWELLSDAYHRARRMEMSPHVGNILGTDRFYPDTRPKGWKQPPEWKLWAHYGVLGVEMETPELYTLGQELKFKALSLLVVSDNLARKEKSLSAKERTQAPKAMVELALKII